MPTAKRSYRAKSRDEYEVLLNKEQAYAHRMWNAMNAFIHGSKALVKPFAQGEWIVDLILTHGTTGRALSEPVVVVSDIGSSVTHRSVYDAYSWASSERCKALGQFALQSDYDLRSLAEKVYQCLKQNESHQ